MIITQCDQCGAFMHAHRKTHSTEVDLRLFMRGTTRRVCVSFAIETAPEGGPIGLPTPVTPDTHLCFRCAVINFRKALDKLEQDYSSTLQEKTLPAPAED